VGIALLMVHPSNAQTQYTGLSGIKTGFAKPNRDSCWHFGVSFGQTLWGDNSTCSCAVPTAAVRMAYEDRLGLGAALEMELSSTIWNLMNTQLEVSAFPALDAKGHRPLGFALGMGFATRLGNNNQVLDEYRGLTYSLDSRLRFSLGKRNNSRVMLALGVQSIAEDFTSENRGGRFAGTRTKMLHSGLRLRIGVLW